MAKILKKHRSEVEDVGKPTTAHTPGETPAPLADLADLQSSV